MPTVTLESAIKKVTVGIPGPPGATAPTFSSVTFDTGAGDPASPAQGEMWWNATEETIDLRQNGAVLQLGQEVQWPVTNKTGSTITNGTVVMATGTIGATGRITIAPMDGTDPTLAKYVLGLATYDIDNNEDGKITAFGKVRGLDTSAWDDGDVLWISSTVAGEMTNVEPDDNEIGMPVAFVVNSNPSVGVLSIRVNPVDEHLTIPNNDTTANLEDITASINVKNKLTGKMVFNTTTNKPVWCSGSLAASVWVDATGATVHTPV